MKIHAHPPRPPTPSMRSIALARRPENAPAREVETKNAEILRVAREKKITEGCQKHGPVDVSDILEAFRRERKDIPQLQHPLGIEA